MGEIGVSADDFKHRLKWWEIQAIIKGYNRRCRNMWSMGRWHAYQILAAMPYCDLKKAGITSPSDLIQFPWDKEEEHLPCLTDEEVADLQSEMRLFNEQEAP